MTSSDFNEEVRNIFVW